MSHPPDHMRDAFEYDPETGIITRDGLPAQRPAARGYLRVCYKHKMYRSARVAWFLYYGVWPDKLIDHINGIKNDDRIANLRLATDEQNSWNRRGYGKYPKGVYKQHNSHKYGAQINVSGKITRMGSFHTIEEASAAYQAAAAQLHGEFYMQARAIQAEIEQRRERIARRLSCDRA